MERMELPEEVLNELKCSLCKSYLSIPPITVISETGEDQICGRCKDVPAKLKIRNNAYEKIAQGTLFPCMYQNCDMKSPWQEVEQHEIECPKASIKCPIFRNCEDIYEISQIQTHFALKHSELLKFDTVICNLSEPDANIHLLIKDNVKYLIYFYSGNFIWMAVFTLSPLVENNGKYSLKIYSDQPENGTFILSDNQPIRVFNEREHCARCIFDYGKCPFKFHKNCGQLFCFPQMTTKIEKSAVKKLLNSELNIIWSITISSEMQATNSNDENSPPRFYIQNNNDNLIQHLECPICNTYMYKPIFVCETGHTICHVCKPQLGMSICPSCKRSMGDSRNYILEEMADSAEIPCRFHNGGCNFIGNTERILVHESNCSFEN
ncbi:hypothetical protein JTB14_016042 [Gonioctena quinquepunctata]|nr:hypothetical protein JTB14_016042 [Gonioctena quinquepunctata]